MCRFWIAVGTLVGRGILPSLPHSVLSKNVDSNNNNNNNKKKKKQKKKNNNNNNSNNYLQAFQHAHRDWTTWPNLPNGQSKLI